MLVSFFAFFGHSVSAKPCTCWDFLLIDTISFDIIYDIIKSVHHVLSTSRLHFCNACS